MECPNCHAENREEANFCKSCGAPLAAAQETSPTTDLPRSEAPLAIADDTTPTEGAPESDTPPAPAGESAPPSVTDTADKEPAVKPPPDADEATEDEATAVDTPTHMPGPPSTPEESPLPTATSEPPPDTAASTPEEQKSRGVEEQRSGGELTPAPLHPCTPAPLSPLQPGVLIAGRFEIVESREHGVEINLYSARDLAICPVCGFADNRPDEDEFCSECGAELRSADSPVMCELQEALSPDIVGVDPDAGVFHDNRFYVAVPEEEIGAVPTDEEPAFPHGVTFSVGYASGVGMVRDLDEDSLCVFTLSGVYESVAEPTMGLFIVADGMGGHEGGEVASKLTGQMVADRLIRNVLLPRFTEADYPLGEAVRTHIKEAISAANARVFQLAQERANDMGCTLTMALVLDDKAYIANVGDSRTYIRDQDGLHQITTDHSVVASLIASGMAEPEELYTHPERHVVYRAIGTKPEVEVDIWEEGLVPGDTLLLCCDGLWEAIRDEGIEEVLLTQFDPQAACEEMIHRANQAGGEDNISMILVKVRAVHPPDKPEALSQE